METSSGQVKFTPKPKPAHGQVWAHNKSGRWAMVLWAGARPPRSFYVTGFFEDGDDFDIDVGPWHGQYTLLDPSPTDVELINRLRAAESRLQSVQITRPETP